MKNKLKKYLKSDTRKKRFEEMSELFNLEPIEDRLKKIYHADVENN